MAWFHFSTIAGPFFLDFDQVLMVEQFELDGMGFFFDQGHHLLPCESGNIAETIPPAFFLQFFDPGMGHHPPIAHKRKILEPQLIFKRLQLLFDRGLVFGSR